MTLVVKGRTSEIGRQKKGHFLTRITRITRMKTCAHVPDGREHEAIASGKKFTADILKHCGEDC
jgi:hypothetical protein